MCYYILVPREQKRNHVLPSQGGRKEGFIMKKFCTKCGREFDAVGREVICPSCKAAAAEETKRAAVLKAKRASWTGESVPVRISGRASTVIREYGKAHDVPFAQALDALLRTTEFFLGLDKAWVDVAPYKSHRRDKHTTEATSTAQDTASKPQDTPQDKPVKQDTPLDKPQDKPVKQAAKASKASKASK